MMMIWWLLTFKMMTIWWLLMSIYSGLSFGCLCSSVTVGTWFLCWLVTWLTFWSLQFVSGLAVWFHFDSLISLFQFNFVFSVWFRFFQFDFVFSVWFRFVLTGARYTLPSAPQRHIHTQGTNWGTLPYYRVLAFSYSRTIQTHYTIVSEP